MVAPGRERGEHGGVRAVAVWIVVVLASSSARAEHLAARVYTTVDGLSNDRVDRGARDRSGYLWFATSEGVSRFDGEHFIRFGVAEGLPAPETHDVIAARDGTIWIATDGGIAWLDPSVATAHPRFALVGTSTGANAVFEAPDGTIWGGTDDGLVKLRAPGRAIAPQKIAFADGVAVLSIASDPRDGTLWLGTTRGLWQRSEHSVHYRVAPLADRDDRVGAVLFDRHGRLWIEHTGAMVFAMTPPIGDAGTPLWERATIKYAPTKGARRNLLEDSHGTMWIGTTDELITYDDATGFRVVPSTALPIDRALSPCVEDSAGNLWFGSNTQGLVRYAPSGFTAFTRADGLETDYVHAFVETADAFYAVTWNNGHVLERFDGTHFTSVRPQPAPSVRAMAWGWQQTVLRDREGAWWYPTADGVERYPVGLAVEALATTPPAWIATTPRLPGRDVFRLYEDRRGDVWIATLSVPGIARWSRATNEIAEVPGVPRGVVAAFAEDTHGALWIAYTDRLLRIRDGGAPETFGTAHGLPSGDLQALLVDTHGRLWIAVNDRGVVRVDDPAAATLRMTAFTTAQGLASDHAMTLVDDEAGRVYVGTSHGIDRIDLDGAIVHFDIADGLPNDYVFSSHRTRDGVLWFGTNAGAARFDPRRVVPTVLPPTYLTSVAVEGEVVPSALAGTPWLELELGSSTDQLDLAFTIPAFAVGDPIRFQYRLDGAEHAWSSPVRERSVHYARLAPGRYQFNVRAVAASGVVAPQATVVFTVLAPIWQRTWFLALCGLGIAGVTYLIVRARVRHVLAIERVRTRIATDLHDELGANLSRISILSEVAIRRAAAEQPMTGQVDEIGKSARELVDVAADIVWSTDPHRDDLGSVIVRLRGFAGDVLEGRGIAWTLTAPPDPGRLKLDPDQRRHLHLIAKEAIHNVAKHSGARTATIAITARNGGIQLVVHDDGVGFAGESGGNGLGNMHARAREAGGTLTIESQAGTTVTFRSARWR